MGLYQVSTLGNVRSLTHTNSDGRCFKGKQLKPILQKTGYVRVHLSKYSQRELPFIHRLVAEVFIPNPNGYTEINHKDENPKNNAVTNLEWCNHSYNINYGERNKKSGIKHRGEKCVFAKLTEKEARYIKTSFSDGWNMDKAKELSYQYGIGTGQIKKIANGESWAWL